MDKFDAANAVVLGVSVDSVKSHQEFCTKDGLHFKLLADTDKKVVAEYGSLGNDMGINGQAQYLPDQSGRQDREGMDRGRSQPPQRRSAGRDQ